MIFSFTHTAEIDWMLPGVQPTGKAVKIGLVAIVKFKNGKVAHEHIYWDQASVLTQIGLLSPKPGLPIAGMETALKLKDPFSPDHPSNTLMKNWAKSQGK
eukprot:gb/GEZN01040524.1/.p1 GENE.gb/GEZN01040524.1/~~gb/GEZN01040524.1/.p1  ORF type:complete len:100 (+),score=20.80 gb/GEZN01040524.1/:2-301(+)